MATGPREQVSADTGQEVRPGERAPRLKLTFKPAAAGQYSIGYHVFQRKPLAQTSDGVLLLGANASDLAAILQDWTRLRATRITGPTPVKADRVEGA